MATAASRSAPSSGQTQMQMQSQAPSSTQTQTQTGTQQAVLHLRGAERGREDVQGEGEEGGETRRRIQWAEDVVDNEGMGKKSSKVCCIYHAPKAIDESSDESSSDSSSGSDSESGDDGSARPARRQGHKHNHNHNHNHNHGKAKGKGKKRSTSPNAYEKVPKLKGSGSKGNP